MAELYRNCAQSFATSHASSGARQRSPCSTRCVIWKTSSSGNHDVPAITNGVIRLHLDFRVRQVMARQRWRAE